VPLDPRRRGADPGAFAGALEEKGRTLSGMTDGRGRDAADRFRVYRNNVVVSLSEALTATFPATRRLLGENFFRAAAVAYAEENKPDSPLIFRYGAGFPDMLAALPGLSAYPFVPEAARIEYARVQAYHAADAQPLAGDALAGVAPELLGAVVLSAHPATRLLDAPNGGLSAWRSNQDPPQPGEEAAAALVTRPAMALQVTGLSAPAATLARSLIEGRPLSEAAAVDGLDLAEALGTLLKAGAFHALRVAETS